MRAQLNEVLPKYYRLRLGICPAGERALDLLTHRGCLKLAKTVTRFISNMSLSDDRSTSTSLVSTASSSPTDTH